MLPRMCNAGQTEYWVSKRSSTTTDVWPERQYRGILRPLVAASHDMRIV